MIDVIFDRSAFHGDYFDRLRHSRLEVACRRGLISVFHTQIFLAETFAMYGRPVSRAELLGQLPFTLGIANGGVFRPLGDILHDELVRGLGPRARVLCSPSELVGLDQMSKDPSSASDYWNAWQEATGERDEAYRKKAVQKKVYGEIRQGLGNTLKELGHRQPLSNYRFEDHLRRTLEENGRAIISSQVPSKNNLALQNRWARDMGSYPFMTAFAQGFAYAGYYAAIQPGKIDRNAQPDYEQMLFLRHADILVTRDDGFLRDAFLALWKPSGKVLMTPDEFVAFVNRIAT
ncbi:hypothetical protein [Massilia sp. YIM B04103]|uniref:hypothetical protein n=1 Tax=Massilia sp. YIM B04103 TaxID=2963106 RepID=UPI00210B1D59|nr:hypothetical protein [Massilia sp. YIM B04103]